MRSQEEGIQHRIEMCSEKVRNTRLKMKHLSNSLRTQGCQAKIAKYRRRIDELNKQVTEKSYPRAIFGSRKLLHQLSIARGDRWNELRKKWRERRSDHFFSVGQANQRGNGNAKLLYEGDGFFLEMRNWPGGDFRVPLRVPEYWSDLVREVITGAASMKLGRTGELLEGGLAYSVRAVRSENGYQVMISFELDEPIMRWNGGVGGVDVNPEGIACTTVSRDGNLLATRFFRDDRLITALKKKRKWVLEDLVNRMLRWCGETYRCNAVVVEVLRFKGAYDNSPRTNFKLSNFMKRKMLQTIRLRALKMGMLSIAVNPAYSSKVALAKYGKLFGGFNRHQLAAFVLARRALGYGEAPALGCVPRTKEKAMWNHCISYYGHPSELLTLPGQEPIEWKSDRDAKGGRTDDELLTAPPAVTSSWMGLSHSPQGVTAIPSTNGRAGRVHPNRHTSGGDGAREHRVSSPHQAINVSPPAVSRNGTKDTVG